MATHSKQRDTSVFQQQEVASPEAMQWGLVIAGGVLIGYGFIRGSLLGLLSATLGTGVLYLGLTRPEARRALNSLGPQIPAEPEPLVEGNQVDEASWESFPASDAPAY